MGVALLALGLVAAGGGWPVAVTLPLLAAAGVGHAWAFSPLANRLTTLARPDQAADLSGLVLTATLVGTSTGVAAFVGVYLSLAPRGSAHALAVTTAVLAGVLVLTAACASCAVSWHPRRWLLPWREG